MKGRFMAEEHLTRKIKRIGIAAFVVLAAALFVYFLLFRGETVAQGLSKFFGILSPILYGFVIAYVLNTPMLVMEKMLLKIWAKRKRTPGKKALSVIRLSCSIVSLLLLLLIVYALFALLLPELVRSVQNIVANVPAYSTNIQNWYAGLVDRYALDTSTKEFMSSILATGQNWISSQFSPQFNGLVSKVTSSVVDILIFLKNILLGLIVSVYVMVSQDSILARARRIFYAFFNVATANRILKNLRFVDDKFGGFLIGKIIDSAIIGVICYIGAMILDLPYALLISVVVGVTNIIPFFGPFIGAIPSAILIWCVAPMQALYFLIFALVLQQFDGNLLGPKILGNSVGVSSFMVLVAILIGGGLFGFMGMIVGVPLCAILTSVIQSTILQRIANKDLPGEIEAYHQIEKLDPWTRKVVKLQPAPKTASLYSRMSSKSAEIAAFTSHLEDNPWDRKAEEVEQERVQFQVEWEADREYCRNHANKRDHYDIHQGVFDFDDNTPETEDDVQPKTSEENVEPKTDRIMVEDKEKCDVKAVQMEKPHDSAKVKEQSVEA